MSLHGAQLQTYVGQVNIVSLKKFMRLVPRKIRDGAADRYTFNMAVGHPMTMAAAMVAEMPPLETAYRQISVEMTPLGAFRPDVHMMEFLEQTVVDPRAKRPALDILESMACKLREKGYGNHGYGTNRTALCIFRIAPRTWVLAEASSFQVVMAVRPSDHQIGAGLVPDGCIPIGIAVKMGRLREVI